MMKTFGNSAFEFLRNLKVDFYLPKTHEILEADSEYWHRNKNEVIRDIYIQSLIKNVKIIHLLEEDLKSENWLKIWMKYRSII